MKNNILFLTAFLSVLIVTSCKKKIENCQLGKSYVTDGTSSPAPNTFYYYPNGKLQKISYSNQSKDTLIYYADSLTILTFDRKDTLTSIFTAVLDASGYVASGSKVSYDYSGNISNTDLYSLEHNTNGNITLQTITNSLGTNTMSLHYTNGNADTATLSDGATIQKLYIFFHNNAENKSAISDLNEVFAPYFGKSSRNLLDSTHIFTPTDTIRIQYAHTLDANDYVSKTIQTYLSPGVQTRYFTYQYFDCSK